MHTVQMMRPIATDAARSVVCVSVSGLVTVQKRLNRSRCRLMADSRGGTMY